MSLRRLEFEVELVRGPPFNGLDGKCVQISDPARSVNWGESVHQHLTTDGTGIFI